TALPCWSILPLHRDPRARSARRQLADNRAIVYGCLFRHLRRSSLDKVQYLGIRRIESANSNAQMESARVTDGYVEKMDASNLSEDVEDHEDMSVLEQNGESEIEQDFKTEDIHPKNDSLEDTECPELGHVIDDLLSHEDTEEAPTCETETEKIIISPTEPPGATELEELQLSINVEEQTELLQELQTENKKLIQLSAHLQTRLAEYFSSKTGYQNVTLDKGVSVEENYKKYLDMIAGVKLEHQRSSKLRTELVEELQQQSTDKLNQVQNELKSFTALKHEAAIATLTGKVGKQEALTKLDGLHAEELKLEHKLASVRLNNIKFKNKIYEYEKALRSRRELVDGLLLMDFEQLKTENQTFKDKLEERSEELHRLQKKIQNKAKHSQLAQKDALVARSREVLTRTRQTRDTLRLDNLALQQRCGLLGNTTLLQDFEEKVDASETLELRLETQKRRHAELMMKCAGLKQKIQQCKTSPR
ncbi:hypothetical protein DNTS_018058, partial [Danionella cerebrum]